MYTKKIKRGDRLTLALSEMKVSDTISIPYRFYSENSIRSTIVQYRSDKDVAFDINARSNTAALVTRIR